MTAKEKMMSDTNVPADQNADDVDAKVAEIDREIRFLFERRLRLCGQIGAIKEWIMDGGGLTSTQR